MLIGIDVGTTAVKAALFDERGFALRRLSCPYQTVRPIPGHVEQNPDDWMALVLRALKELSDGVTVAAIGLCSQVNTHVFVDDHGRALLSAFTWQDTRCASDAAAIDSQIKTNDKITWWGAPLPVDSSHVLARMAYVARVHPNLWARTRFVLAPKDFCIAQLTDEVIADPMTNFGILDQSLSLIDPLVDILPGAKSRLPRISGFTSLAGSVRSGLPCEGVPVVTGAMDAWSGLFGAGVSQEGDGLYLSGTSEILGLISGQRHPTPGVISFAACEGMTLHAGPTQSGGASVQWAAKLLGVDVLDLSALAAHADHRHVPLFLPHLEGERAPLWDVDAKGSFLGLTSSSGPAELAYSVLEGVAYSARLVFESLAKSAGRDGSVIHYSGGGSRSDLWSQIRSDVLQTPLKRTMTSDAGVIGAALIAGVGIGLFESLTSATQKFVQYDRMFEPDLNLQSRHDERFSSYQLAYEQLKPVNHML